MSLYLMHTDEFFVYEVDIVKLIESEDFKRMDSEDVFESLIFVNHCLLILKEKPEEVNF